MLVEKRETRYRVMWYYRLFEETQRGLTRYPNSLEHIHGSLLALGELLRHTGAAAFHAEGAWGKMLCPSLPASITGGLASLGVRTWKPPSCKGTCPIPQG